MGRHSESNGAIFWGNNGESGFMGLRRATNSRLTRRLYFV